ncbi:hypothetical protein OGATHE_001782 [Ogataea polymorpha]|uniref:Uncharacterized protein n=1 Tax=Ogataea polymorpha TaxID=460523 RepID=A0A9P8PKK5_9ASCO|nr:hypothetical protein OGATHE_001782 [Ogataea polymorpha]
MFVVCDSLNGGLSNVGEETCTKTKKTLSTDQTVLGAVSSSVFDHQSHGNKPHSNTKNNKGLQPSDVCDSKSKDSTRDHRDERVQTGNSGSRLDGLVEANHNNRVQVVTLHVPNHINENGDHQGSPHRSVLHVLSLKEWVFCEFCFPKEEKWQQAETNDQRCNDFSLLPFRLDSSGQSEWGQNEPKTEHHGKQTNQVDFPEKRLNNETLETQSSEVGNPLKSVNVSAAVRKVVHVHKAEYQWNTGQRKNKGPHTNTPRPASRAQNC